MFIRSLCSLKSHRENVDFLVIKVKQHMRGRRTQGTHWVTVCKAMDGPLARSRGFELRHEKEFCGQTQKQGKSLRRAQGMSPESGEGLDDVGPTFVLFCGPLANQCYNQ